MVANHAVEDDGSTPEVWTDRRRFLRVGVLKVEVLEVLRSRTFVGREVNEVDSGLRFVSAEVL